MKTPDITYKDHGLFTAFYAETKEGENAWRELASVTDGTGKVLTVQAKQFIASLRSAGYVVQKAKESKQSLDDIFAELDE
jgi:hypothetical protein